tara:strand:+ start:2626 stop:9318 length:6693 start_codon:yes stop_codon:yes gene_type:complete
MANKTKEFSDFQVRECDEILGEVLPPDFCPTCIPNPNAVVPIWYEEEQPFLNEKECLYQVSVTVNDAGEYLDPSEIRRLREELSIETEEQSDAAQNKVSSGTLDLIKSLAIRRGFLKTGIRELIRYYNKLEADATVFAFGDKEYNIERINRFLFLQKELFAFYITATDIDSMEEILSLKDFLEKAGLPPITSDRYQQMIDLYKDVYPLGLEWVASIDDVHIEFYQTADGGTPIKFLVSVPADHFDLIPEDTSSDEEEDLPVDQVVLDAGRIKGQILRLGTAMWVFSNYQKHFIDTEGGRVYFKDEPGNTFRALTYREKVLEFRDDLIEMLHDNDYRLPFELGLARELVSQIKITFNNSDPEKLYIIKKIEVKREGCRGWTRIRKFRPKGFRNDTNKGQRTAMGYIAKIDEIDQRLTARKTINWLEFLQGYTYPEIKINYGESPDDIPTDERSAISCILEKDFGLGSGAGRDFLLSEVLSFWDSLAYEYNKRQCEPDQDPSKDEQKKIQEDIEKQYEELIKRQIKEDIRKNTRILRASGVENAAEVARDEFDLDPEEYAARNPASARALKEQAEQQITESGIVGFPYYTLAKEAALERFDYEDSLIHAVMTIFQGPKGKLKFPGEDPVQKVLNIIGQCGMNKMLMKAIQCLLGGMTLNQALAAMIRSALKAMTAGDLGRLFVGLPYDQQQEVLRKVQAELGNIPPPWDDNYKAGEVETTFSNPSEKSVSFTQEEWNAQSNADRSDALESWEEQGFAAEEGKIKEQGSIGEAAGNVQGIIIDAYIEALMDTVAVESLLNELDKFPGAEIIAKVILQLRCPTKPLFQPSPKDFLKTLTLDICDPTIGLTRPRLRRISWPGWKKIFRNLVDAAKEALKQMFLRILVKLLFKLLVTLESILCRSLDAAGQFLADAVNPNVVGDSLRQAFRDAFCGEEESDQRVDEIMENTLGYMGFGDGEAARSAIQAISVTTTPEELLAMFVTSPMNHDPRALTRIANTIRAAVPEFADTLGSPEQVSELFTGLGEFIPPGDRAEIRNNLQAVGPDRPINASICLTNDEFEEWNHIRENILMNSGLEPEEAAEYVNDLNQKAIDRVGEFMQELAKLDSPGGLAGEEFAKMMDPNGGGDPLCANGPMVDIFRPHRNEELGPVLNGLANQIYDQIQVQYTKDLIGRKGILNFILADTRDKVYTSHVRLTRNFLTGRFYTNSIEDYAAAQDDQIFPSIVDPRGMFPETVCVDLRNQMISQTLDFAGTTDIQSRKTYTPEVKFFDGVPNLNLKKVIRARKKPDFKLEYASGGEIDLTMNISVDADFKVIGTFANGVASGSELKKNLNYFVSFKNNTTIGTGKTKETIAEYVVERPPTPEEQNMISEIEGDSDWSPTGNSTYIAYLFRKYVDNKWKDSEGYTKLSNDSMYNKINTHTLNLMKDYLLTKPGSDPTSTNPRDMSTGFLFGYEYDEVNADPEYFEYVGPDGEEYNYDEEEAVLGKMKKESPRVKILNPETYGGRYSNPKFYVEPPERNGWLGLVDTLIPKPQTCDKEVDLLDIEQIKSKVAEVAASIPYDDRLDMERVCAREVPFDHIVSSTTHSNIQGIVSVLNRTFLIQQFMTGIPAFASLSLTPQNYDDCFYELVANQMKNSMIEESPWIGAFTKIKEYNYWLLFLEQCVQIYSRGVDAGEFQPNDRLTEVLRKIRTAQEKYYWPEDRDDYNILKDRNTFNLPGRVLTVDDIGRGDFYSYSIGYQAFGDLIFESTDETKFRVKSYFRMMPMLRFATKILTIRVVENQCIEVLKELLKNEASIIFEQFNDRMKPRSPINNIQKYMFGLSDYSIGSTLKVGTTQYVMDKSMDAEADPGNIPHVISDPKIDSPLDSGGYDPLILAESGLFVVEKYLRLVDKEDQSDVPGFIQSRPDNLYGVVNLKDFRRFVQNNPSANTKYSDCFGDLRFVYEAKVKNLKEYGIAYEDMLRIIVGVDDLTGRQIKSLLKNPENNIMFDGASVPQELIDRYDLEPKSVAGSTGIKYGIRVSFVPPSGFRGGKVKSSVAMREKSLNVKAVGDPSTQYIFTIASAEIDLVDDKLSNFDWKDSETDPYDLECMMDKLVLDPNYQMFFDRFVPLRTYSSFIASFISLSFLPALGEDEAEREKDDGFFTPKDPEGLSGWNRAIFRKTKKTCRRLFANFYNSNDFNPDDNLDLTLRDFFDQFNPFSNVVPQALTWWQLRKLSDKPSAECANPFMDLFKS